MRNEIVCLNFNQLLMPHLAIFIVQKCVEDDGKEGSTIGNENIANDSGKWLLTKDDTQ
jgi:hypothetical protein